MYYLDHCGSTPLAAEVQEALSSFIRSGNFGNPSATHHEAGRGAFDAVENARASIAEALGAHSDQIIFTSGATEANNLILWGFALRYQGQGCHIIYGATEHKSVFDTCGALADFSGVSIEEAPVDDKGIVQLASLESALAASAGRPTLVALMHINNEIPARTPVEEVSRLCLKYGAFFHCDGVQGFVREPLNFRGGLYGSYVISTHKIYGPKGLGVLVLGDGSLSPRITPPYHGGSHERGLRPGTLNTLAIVAGSTAITTHENKRAARLTHMSQCANLFVKELQATLPDFKLTVPLNDTAAGIVNFYISGLDAPTLLASIGHICMNRGASCTGSGGEKFSHVPKALGLPIEIQANVLRASFGDALSREDTILAARDFARAVTALKIPR